MSDNTTFDADAFMNTEVNEANETKFTPVPEDTYVAICTGVKARVAGDNQVLDLTWEIDNPGLAEKLGREKLTVRQSLFLDLVNGALDFGPNKNVQLGKAREALGQNKSGKAWSPRMLEGAGPAQIVVKHRVDKEDSSIIYDGVSKVLPM